MMPFFVYNHTHAHKHKQTKSNAKSRPAKGRQSVANEAKIHGIYTQDRDFVVANGHKLDGCP